MIIFASQSWFGGIKVGPGRDALGDVIKMIVSTEYEVNAMLVDNRINMLWGKRADCFCQGDVL